MIMDHNTWYQSIDYRANSSMENLWFERELESTTRQQAYQYSPSSYYQPPPTEPEYDPYCSCSDCYNPHQHTTNDLHDCSYQSSSSTIDRDFDYWSFLDDDVAVLSKSTFRVLDQQVDEGMVFDEKSERESDRESLNEIKVLIQQLLEYMNNWDQKMNSTAMGESTTQKFQQEVIETTKEDLYEVRSTNEHKVFDEMTERKLEGANKEWPPLVEEVDTVELPERYNAAKGEGTALSGIIQEIRSTWASGDNSLLLWRFDEWEGQYHKYSGEEQANCAVGVLIIQQNDESKVRDQLEALTHPEIHVMPSSNSSNVLFHNENNVIAPALTRTDEVRESTNDDMFDDVFVPGIIDWKVIMNGYSGVHVRGVRAWYVSNDIWPLKIFRNNMVSIKDDGTSTTHRVTEMGVGPDVTHTIIEQHYDGYGGVWKTGGVCTHLLGHGEPVTSATVINSEGVKTVTVVTGSKDRSLRLWKLDMEETSLTKKITAFKILRGHRAAVQSVASQPSGDRVYSGSWDSTINLWRTNELDAGGDSVAIKKRKKGSVVVETQLEEEAASTLVGHTQCLSSVVWRQQRTIQSASWDHSIRRWDVETGKESLNMYSGKALNCLDVGIKSLALIAAGVLTPY